MTQNQLRYWELRWRQHYENAQIQIEREKVALEIAKLEETIRKNRKAERQEQQRIIQEGIKIQQAWQKLGFEMQAKIVELGLEKRKLDQKDTELVQAADRLLKDKFVAIADFVTNMTEKRDKSQQEWARIYRDAGSALTDAFGGKTLGLAAGEFRGLVSGEEFTNGIKAMADAFPEYASIINQFTGLAKETIQRNVEQYGPQWQGPPKPGKPGDNIISTDPRLKVGANMSTGPENTVSGHTSTEDPKGQTKTKVKGSSGADYYDNHSSAGSTKSPVESRTQGGSRVIWSGGSHYGPGFQTQGGFY